MSNRLLIELGKHIKEQFRPPFQKHLRQAVLFDSGWYSWLLEQRDTSDVWRQFAIWVLVHPKDGVIRLTKPNSIQYDAISNVAQLYTEDCKDIQTWEKAIDRASSAAEAVYAAGYAAGNSYGYTDAYYAARAAIFAAYAAADNYAAARAGIDPVNLAYDAAKFHSYVVAIKTAETARYDRNERMADKLIELLLAAPQKIMVGTIDDASMYNAADPAGSTVLATIYVPEPPVINENLINKQERIIDDMDHSKEISFSISHHNGTKHIMRGKETIEGAVNRIECALSIVKSVLKDDNTSECTNIDLNITSGRIIIT